MTPVGYRFFLKEATANYATNLGENLNINMIWQNLGTTQVHPKLGQNFEFQLYLLDDISYTVHFDYKIETDISKWMPAEVLTTSPSPEYLISTDIPIPATLSEGSYLVAIAIINTRTGLPINLAMDGEYSDGKFILFKIKIKQG
jgi:hypothetical protein